VAHQHAKLEAIAPIRRRTRETLSVYGRALWFERMNANMNQPPQTLEALARILPRALRERVEGLPNANAVRAIEQAVAQLGAAQGVFPEALAAIAEKHVRRRRRTSCRNFSTLAATQTELFHGRRHSRPIARDLAMAS